MLTGYVDLPVTINLFIEFLLNNSVDFKLKLPIYRTFRNTPRNTPSYNRLSYRCGDQRTSKQDKQAYIRVGEM